MNGTSAESKFAVGLILGFAIGAAIAIITAPESGLKTREYLRKKIINTGESVKGAAEELTEKAKDFTFALANISSAISMAIKCPFVPSFFNR